MNAFAGGAALAVAVVVLGGQQPPLAVFPGIVGAGVGQTLAWLVGVGGPSAIVTGGLVGWCGRPGGRKRNVQALGIATLGYAWLGGALVATTLSALGHGGPPPPVLWMPDLYALPLVLGVVCLWSLLAELRSGDRDPVVEQE